MGQKPGRKPNPEMLWRIAKRHSRFAEYPLPPSYPPPLHQVSKLLVFSDLREDRFVKFFVFRSLGSGGLENKGVKNLLKNPAA